MCSFISCGYLTAFPFSVFISFIMVLFFRVLDFYIALSTPRFYILPVISLLCVLTIHFMRLLRICHAFLVDRLRTFESSWLLGCASCFPEAAPIFAVPPNFLLLVFWILVLTVLLNIFLRWFLKLCQICNGLHLVSFRFKVSVSIISFISKLYSGIM